MEALVQDVLMTRTVKTYHVYRVYVEVSGQSVTGTATVLTLTVVPILLHKTVYVVESAQYVVQMRIV